MAWPSKYGASLVLVPILAAFVLVASAASIETAYTWNDVNDRIMRFSQDEEVVKETSEPVKERSEARSPRFDLYIDVTRSLHITSPRYMSVTISGGRLVRGLQGFDFKNPKLRNIAVELAPTYVRFGGTLADFIDFDPYLDASSSSHGSDSLKGGFTERDIADFEEDAEDYEEDYEDTPEDPLERNLFKRRAKMVGKKRMPNKFILTGGMWDNITRWCDNAGWDIMWDLNLLHTDKNRWDPTHARKFMKYCASRGIRIPAFQLGNEPNLYKPKFGLDIDGNKLAQDFWTLKDVVSEIPQFVNSGLYGPDVTSLADHKSARTYLQQFLSNQGCDAVTEVSLHHYYLDNQATSRDFMDPKVMDSLRVQLEYAYNISWASCRVRKPVRLSETSTATGGGIEGVTNAFVAGFLWLDKLGLSATFGVTHVFRQTFFSSKYALVSEFMEPYPDYYLSVVYKRLVEGPVFKVLSGGMSPLVRVYAHCVSKRYYKYPDGAIVVYYLNVAAEETHLATSQLLSSESNEDLHVDLFVFTPGDEAGLQSKKVKLNGEVLEMNGPIVPKMEPMMHRGDVGLAPHSYGFMVIPYAQVPLCMYYHRNEDI